MISFSGGCVINLDDLEDFPDYFQVMTTLLASIKQKKVDWKSMKTFLEAQLQDIQHMPQFMQLISILTANFNQIFTQSHSHEKTKCLTLLLKLLKSYFTSFTIQQKQIQPVIELLTHEVVHHCQLFCDFFLAISKFAPYMENHQQFIKFYIAVANEKKIVENQDMVLWYVKGVDKILRFRAFRECFAKIIHHKQGDWKSKFPFLMFKFSMYSKNKEQIKNALKQLEKQIHQDQKSSKYIINYVQSKKKQFL